MARTATRVGWAVSRRIGQLLLLACLCGVVPEAAPAQAANAASMAAMSLDDFSQWMTYYYRAKQPELMPAAIQRASALGLFDDKTLPPMLGLLAGFFAENPGRIDATLAAVQPSLPARDFQAVLTAAMLGAPGGSPQQNALFARLDDDGMYLFNALIANGIHGEADVEPKTANALDFLWGVFFATGDANSVLPIVSIIDTPKEPEIVTKQDVMTLAVHGAAAWSLCDNARQHPAIMALCKEQIGKQPPEIAAKLRKIVQGN